MKYIDADRLKAEIENHIKEVKNAAEKFALNMGFFDAKLSGIYDVMAIIDSLQQEQDILVINKKDWEEQEKFLKNKKFGVPLQQEQPDFPPTDEQMKEFLATHPKIKVPEKYKNPDWLFKKLEQQEVDLEKAAQHVYESWMGGTMDDVRRDMVELGKVLNARKEGTL